LVDVLGWLTRWWLVGRHANAVSNGVAPNASGPNCACHHVFALILHILHAFKFLGNVLLQFLNTRGWLEHCGLGQGPTKRGVKACLAFFGMVMVVVQQHTNKKDGTTFESLSSRTS
jgi:hypothetical protein